jgi:uracil-DNA glycosylase
MKIEGLSESWNELLSHEFTKPYLTQLIHEVNKSYAASQVFPPREKLFKAFDLCPPEKVKVVILGQDPYHQPGQAHGLCFSVNEGVKIPPSLRNIFKELERDIAGFVPPSSGSLEAWARQGVLLLNAILTVRASEPGSHGKMGWESFTDAVIRALSDSRDHIVFMLWGNYAKLKASLIDQEKHLVLTAAHPSPLAREGFAGCGHFSKANQYLSNNGKEPVNWQL